jgi:hypothetical protein
VLAGKVRIRWTWLAVIFLLLLVAAVVVWQFQRRQTISHVTLPDGRQITLRAVTVGTNSTYIAGNLFQRTVGPRLPAKLKARFKVQEMQLQPEPATRGIELLVAWLEVSPATNAITDMIIARVADDAGHEQVASRANASGGALPSGGWVSAHEFSSFPRRSRFLTVRAYSIKGGRLDHLAEFRVRNPAYGKYPVWTPEGMPITRETNGLRFTVTQFNTGLYATGHLASMGSNWTEIIYDYESGPWRPLEITISDAAGNRIYKRTPSQRMMAAPMPAGIKPAFDTWRKGMVSLPATLWLDEPAWKVNLHLERFQRGSFPSNTWWEVKDVRVPPRGQTNRVNASHPDHGTNVIFKSLVVSGAHIRVELQRPRGSDVLATLLAVTDERGTNFHFTLDSPGRPDAYLVHFAAADATSLNFRFAVHKRVTLEFVAKPQLLHRLITKDDEW